MMRPTLDQVHIKVVMNKEDMDTFIMCVATKKTAQHFSKEMADLVSHRQHWIILHYFMRYVYLLLQNVKWIIVFYNPISFRSF